MKHLILGLLLAFSIAKAEVQLISETVISSSKDTVIVAELCINGYVWVTTMIETGRPVQQAFKISELSGRPIPVQCKLR